MMADYDLSYVDVYWAYLTSRLSIKDRTRFEKNGGSTAIILSGTLAKMAKFDKEGIEDYCNKLLNDIFQGKNSKR